MLWMTRAAKYQSWTRYSPLIFSTGAETGRGVALSTDEGSTWSTLAHLETEPGQYDYPSATVDPDGTIHLTYSWREHERIKHVTFDENWVIESGSPLSAVEG